MNVLITGASRGIGLGLAKQYLKEGCAVAATATDPENTAVFAELKAEYGDTFFPVKLNLTDEASICALREKLAGFAFDLAINNAGISVEENCGAWTQIHFENHFKVNATGPALVAQVIFPLMKTGAKLVNMTSGMGSLEMNINPLNGLDAYAMSKAALNMLTRRLAEKLRPKSILVTAISPGWVQTDMGGADAPATVDEAVRDLTATIAQLKPEQSGAFLSEKGEILPW